MMHITIQGSGEQAVHIDVPGKYSPDVFDDMCRRASRTYSEVLTAEAQSDNVAELEALVVIDD